MGEYVPFSGTSWTDTTVDIEWVCALLEIKPASLHQLVLRGVFPSSTAPRGRPGCWPMVDVLRFVTDQRRNVVNRLPRLYPRVQPLVPALFLEAIPLQASTVPEISDEYLLNLWQPADGGPPIAVAYGLSGHGPRRAAPILAALQRNPATAEVAAVAVPGHGGWTEQGAVILPEIDYADTSPFDHRIQPTWLDLAYLLQTDAPLWPTHLRNRDAMRGWRPGDPPYPVVPSSPLWGVPTDLLRLCDGTDDDSVIQFYRAWAEEIAHRTCPCNGVTAATPLPAGVTLAAHAVSPLTGTPLFPRPADERDLPPVPPGLTAHVLHSTIRRQEDLLRISDMAAVFHLWRPWISNTVHLRSAPANPLARQWLHRLHTLEGHDTEVGYLHIRELAREEFEVENPPSFTPVRLVDPLCPDLWIVRSGHLVSLTVPAAIPTATGTLQQLDLTQDWDRDHSDHRPAFSAWWTDSAGIAWPMPGPQNYSAGYNGTGPGDLAEAATALAYDATRSVGYPLDRRAHNPRCDELRAMLTRRRFPTLVRRTTSDTAGQFQWLAAAT